MPRSGFAGAITATPAGSSRSITPFQLEASAKAPWTRTTVGCASDMWCSSQRSGLKALRSSSVKISGSCQAAKWLPSATSLK
jgi:hypothetical protein